jgi:hypothetical protein
MLLARTFVFVPGAIGRPSTVAQQINRFLLYNPSVSPLSFITHWREGQDRARVQFGTLFYVLGGEYTRWWVAEFGGDGTTSPEDRVNTFLTNNPALFPALLTEVGNGEVDLNWRKLLLICADAGYTAQGANAGTVIGAPGVPVAVGAYGLFFDPNTPTRPGISALNLGNSTWPPGGRAPLFRTLLNFPDINALAGIGPCGQLDPQAPGPVPVVTQYPDECFSDELVANETFTTCSTTPPSSTSSTSTTTTTSTSTTTSTTTTSTTTTSTTTTSSSTTSTSSTTTSSTTTTTTPPPFGPCDMYYFTAHYNCESLAWEAGFSDVTEDVVCADDLDWFISVGTEEPCIAEKLMYVPHGDPPPVPGLPAFIPGPDCCNPTTTTTTPPPPNACDRYYFTAHYLCEELVWEAGFSDVTEEVDCEADLDWFISEGTEEPCLAEKVMYVLHGAPPPVPGLPAFLPGPECCDPTTSTTTSSTTSTTTTSTSTTSTSSTTSTTTTAPAMCDHYFYQAEYTCPAGPWVLTLTEVETNIPCNPDVPWVQSEGNPCGAYQTLDVPTGNPPPVPGLPSFEPDAECCSIPTTTTTSTTTTTTTSTTTTTTTTTAPPSESSCYRLYDSNFDCDLLEWTTPSPVGGPDCYSDPRPTSWTLQSACTAVIYVAPDGGPLVCTGSSDCTEESYTAPGAPDIAPDPSCCPGLCDVWSFTAQWNCDTESWDIAAMGMIAEGVTCGTNDGWAPLVDNCLLQNHIFVPTGYGSPGTPADPVGFDISACCEPPLDPCTEGPEELTSVYTIGSGSSCDSGCTGTEIYKKTASTATTVTYSLIYLAYDNPSDPDCFLCGPTGVLVDNPSNTSADWIWDCSLNAWTTGGWSCNDGDCNPQLNQFTGECVIVQDQCGWPWEESRTLTVSGT